LTELFNCWNF